MTNVRLQAGVRIDSYVVKLDLPFVVSVLSAEKPQAWKAHKT